MSFNMDDDSLVWHDNTRVTFVNWDSDAPSLARADVCAALNVTTGKWKHVSCAEERENGVVCEAAQKTEEQNSNHNPLLTALVVLSVLIIVGVSAILWCVHQRHNFGSVFTAFEYHPPFRSPTADEAALVDSEETEDMA
ncbi:CD302 antigen isoform X2 [Conger conger]|nr:CD302 antigen isoform X2 [Conger conger]